MIGTTSFPPSTSHSPFFPLTIVTVVLTAAWAQTSSSSSSSAAEASSTTACNLIDCASLLPRNPDDAFEWLKCGDNPNLCHPARCRCDGNANCLAGGDEMGCGQNHQFGCRSGFWKCVDGSRCIPRMRKCDSFHDCIDESDESATTCGHDHVKNPDDQRQESQEHDRNNGQDDNYEEQKGQGRVINVLGITLTTLVLVVGMLSVGMVVLCLGRCWRRRQQLRREISLQQLQQSGFMPGFAGVPMVPIATNNYTGDMQPPVNFPLTISSAEEASMVTATPATRLDHPGMANAPHNASLGGFSPPETLTATSLPSNISDWSPITNLAGLPPPSILPGISPRPSLAGMSPPPYTEETPTGSNNSSIDRLRREKPPAYGEIFTLSGSSGIEAIQGVRNGSTSPPQSLSSSQSSSAGIKASRGEPNL